MKITGAKYDQAGLSVQFDGGGWGRIDWKKQMLDYGVAVFIPPVGSRLPNWKFHIPPFQGDNSHEVQRGTSDPVLVCMARRAYSRMNMPERITPSEICPGVMVEEEAIRELASGRDILGGKWPVPEALLMPLAETIAEAKP